MSQRGAQPQQVLLQRAGQSGLAAEGTGEGCTCWDAAAAAAGMGLVAACKQRSVHSQSGVQDRRLLLLLLLLVMPGQNNAPARQYSLVACQRKGPERPGSSCDPCCSSWLPAWQRGLPLLDLLLEETWSLPRFGIAVRTNLEDARIAKGPGEGGAF